MQQQMTAICWGVVEYTGQLQHVLAQVGWLEAQCHLWGQVHNTLSCVDSPLVIPRSMPPHAALNPYTHLRPVTSGGALLLA